MASRYLPVIVILLVGALSSIVLLFLSSSPTKHIRPICTNETDIWDSNHGTARTPAGYPARGVIYAVASMEQGHDKAALLLDYTFRAAELATHYAPGLFATLFTDKALFNEYVQTHQIQTTRPFAQVVFFEDKLNEPLSSTTQNTSWTGQKIPSIWLKKIVSFQHTPYPLTAFLDSDTCFCGPEGVEKLFNVLAKGGDIAYILEKDAPSPSYRNISLEFPERNTGVVVYHTNAQVRRLLRLWERHFLRALRTGLRHQHDQASLREALYDINAEANEDIGHPSSTPAQVSEVILRHRRDVCRGYGHRKRNRCRTSTSEEGGPGCSEQCWIVIKYML
eukprot:CAMPEP_0118956920 /NCGR_PEP_ID=MMETSP1169-20130426/61831_1 /TAXON_ID=36882 /ORGANISM="Pyramimonas obovata, Strain CCMP722" /LENGTH=334 /DNA_ID=CAMNT_0006904971 /DNA_START=363 /DNA_END=1367 /DNA_ORIENTATION=-